MDTFVAAVKGVSASGKSSRVFQLLKFFEDSGATIEDFYYTNVEGKSRLVGVLVKELNIIFIGRIYSSGSIQRWQGYDSVTGCFVKSEHFSKFLMDNSSKYSFIIEGAGVTGTNRLRPLFLHEYCGFNNIFMKYYNFEESQKEEYLERIMSRSGKLPGKGTMWDKVKGFEFDYNKSVEEVKSLNKATSFVEYGGYLDPIDDFGIKLIMFLNIGDDMVMEFMEFVERFDYISKNKFENFQ
jgi:hypothetical protein